ncbi:uncharacterized protein LOC131845612 [Achroia grisella]|uniref:uncharacterized protein LOC131845612 n=1 Tax=Achroia grisella TaxID=688607 RepID=UPI0027D30772|nr:uncharacterized protein LOC131845612 [Achroia grisella]
MDRNNMRSSYVNSGSRSLPHMGGNKRHNGSGHNGNGHRDNGHNGNGHNSARLSPPAQTSPGNSQNSQHDDLINYIYDSWNKVTRDISTEEARYYQDPLGPRQLANFRPFNLEEWWARRLVQSINRNKHRS